jgi:lipoprotein-releasing system ATP-binding protein
MGDEPTGNLDSKNAANVFDILKDLSKEQDLSLLIVTHNNYFAYKTDRIIEMFNGRIIDHDKKFQDLDILKNRYLLLQKKAQ